MAFCFLRLEWIIKKARALDGFKARVITGQVFLPQVTTLVEFQGDLTCFGALIITSFPPQKETSLALTFIQLTLLLPELLELIDCNTAVKIRRIAGVCKFTA